LEEILGISRRATDKPARIVEAIEALGDEAIPVALRSAVRR
jgi:hypothetical protein